MLRLVALSAGCGTAAPASAIRSVGIAAIERQFLDSLVLDDLTDGRAARFDQRCRRLDRHRLGEFADGHLDHDCRDWR